MNSSKDDIELLIDDLKIVLTSLYRHQSSQQVQESINYLNRAIAILEAYKSEVNSRQFQPPKPLTHKYNFSERNTLSIQNNSSNYSSANNSHKCGIGRHWVRRRLKNGDSGYCRNNPKRKS